MVKYNELDTSTSIDFITFWTDSEHTDEMKISNNEIYGPNDFTCDTLRKNNYNGYLKIAGIMDTAGGGYITVDGINLIIHDDGYFEFEGNVESIEIMCGVTNTFTFSEFSTIPLLSERTKDFYVNIPEENNELWGELLLNIKPRAGTIDWYNINNDIPEQKMRFWNENFVTKTDPPTSDDEMSSDLWILIDVSAEKNSGYTELYYDASPYDDTFPILIHKNDIGKQNNIGPFVTTDNKKFTINLTII